jgi:activating signal cointegrator 1
MVAGVKRVEGRSWSSTHRGVLWIHAAARRLHADELDTVCGQYRALGTPPAHFPHHRLIGRSVATAAHPESPSSSVRELGTPAQLAECYPTGVLLGYVCVEAVLPREQHRAQVLSSASAITSETTECAYAFLCSSPVLLPRPIPMKGQHKIWRLPADVHQYACAQLANAK